MLTLIESIIAPIPTALVRAIKLPFISIPMHPILVSRGLLLDSGIIVLNFI